LSVQSASDPAVPAPALSDAKTHPHSRLVFGCVFLSALAMRLLYLWGQARNNPLFEHPMVDAMFHQRWAEQIASGEGMGATPFFRAPFYYYMLGVLYKVFGCHVVVGRLTGCLIGAATCYVIARLGEALGGFRVGVLAGFIAAIYWPFIYFDGELLTVGLEVFLGTTMLLLLVRAAARQSRLLCLIAGIVWGLAAITRPTVLTFGLGIAVWAWISAEKPGRLRKAVVTLGLTCVGAMLAILPVTIRNYVVGKEAVLIATSGGVNFYIGNNPKSDGVTPAIPGTRTTFLGTLEDTRRIAEKEMGRELTETEVSRYWYDKAFDWIKKRPIGWCMLTLRKLRLFWSPVEIPNNQAIWPAARLSAVSNLFWVGFPVVTCLGGIGLVLLYGDWRKWALPLLFLLIQMLTVVAFFCTARYRLPIVPVLILLSAVALSRLIEMPRSREFASLGTSIIVGCLCAFALWTNPPNRKNFRAGVEAGWEHALGSYYARPAPEGPGDDRQALVHFQRSAELAPRLAESKLGLAKTLLRLKEYQKAEKRFAVVLRLQPNHMGARWGCASALEGLGRRAAAAEQYRLIIRRQPQNALAHERLGCLLGEMENKEEARRMLRRAIELDPDLKDAPDCLEALRD
jgi:4-amino-4-deoxy-L-arabinose transferase-like glycosyltransferase